MNNKLTYVEARDKIWASYFRDEINPFNCNFCFCGTLAGDTTWIHEDGLYSCNQYELMESALINPLHVLAQSTETRPALISEDSLFDGMLAAIEVLKQIHRERGEIIPEDEPSLTKRNHFERESNRS